MITRILARTSALLTLAVVPAVAQAGDPQAARTGRSPGVTAGRGCTRPFGVRVGYHFNSRGATL